MGGLNTLRRKIATKSLFESALAALSSDVSFNQGDLLYFDTSGKLINTLTQESDAATFLGIAPVTVVNGKIPSPYSTPVDGSRAITEIPGPQYGDVHAVLGKPGDAFTEGCAVYASPTDGDRYVSVSGTKQIGIYNGAAVTAASSDTPTTVECLIGARYPNDVLKF